MIFQLIKLLFENPLMFVLAVVLITVPLLISITIHEWSHGFVAYKFGDPTPKLQGRLSLNPFRHLDPIGTLMLFIVGIGWAKPVEINPNNIPGRTKQMLVALAGPASNFLMAIIFCFIFYLVNHFAPQNSIMSIIITILALLVQINIILGLFNLIPIPPLDGSNILRWILPPPIDRLYSNLAPFGMIILIIILFTVGFSFIFNLSKILEGWLYTGIEHLLKPLLG